MTKMITENETKAVKISSKYGVHMMLVVRETGETPVTPAGKVQARWNSGCKFRDGGQFYENQNTNPIK